MTRTLLSDRVVIGADLLDVTPAAITIDGSNIVAVERVDRADPSWARALEAGEALDLGDRLITPAFINGHTHLAMSALRGVGLDAMEGNIVESVYFRLEGALSPEDVGAFARMGAYESLLAGVGTVWDHYYHAPAIAIALAEVGLCGIVAPTLQDLSGPGVPHLEATFEATSDIGEDSMLRDAGVVPALGPHATDTVSEAVWRRLAELAEARNWPIHAHVAQSIEEYQRAIERHGCSPVEWLERLGVLDAGAGMLLVHGLYLSASDLARLRPTRNVLGYCPFSQIQFGFPAAVEGWSKAGIPFVVGTDCGACNDSMSVQQELRLLANGRAFAITPSPAGALFRASGELVDARAVDRVRRSTRGERVSLADPATLLSTVWSVPGDMHPALAVGRIAPGYRANLCVWETDEPAWWPATAPLRTLTMGDVAGTLWGLMTNGQWRGTPGDFRGSILRSDAYRQARDEANARLDALVARSGLSLG